MLGMTGKNFPLTATALFQHVLRVSYITDHVWHQSLMFFHDYQTQENGNGNWRKVFTFLTGQSYKRRRK